MRYLLIILLSVFTASVQAQSKQQDQTVDLKIVITNVDAQKGKIELGVFNNSKDFLRKGSEFKAYSQKVSGNTLTIYVKDLPKGDYAVSLFHDVNSDNKCNLSILARPSEPYGFSNNVKLRIFKPDYDDCKFTANEDKTISIKLID